MPETFPRRVVAQRRFALGSWAWLIAGLVLIACAAIFRQWEFVWLAVWPLAMAFFLQAFAEPRVEIQLAENSLSINGRPITYDSILRVKALTEGAQTPAATQAFRILVRHAAGQLIIPAKLDTPSPELLTFLQARAPAFVLQLDPRLHEYLQRQEGQYGNLVSIYVGENGATETRSWGLAKAILATAVVCGMVGFVGYATPWRNEAALILGLVSTVVFVVTGLLLFVSYRQWLGNNNVEAAALVVSPGGLAMIQGELVGELRWEEIRQAKLAKGAIALGRNRQYRGACIQLFVEGATISIADIYHQPLSQIYASILRLRSL